MPYTARISMLTRLQRKRMEQMKRIILRERSSLVLNLSVPMSQPVSKWTRRVIFMARLSHAQIQQGACMRRISNVLQNQTFLSSYSKRGQCRQISILISMPILANCNFMLNTKGHGLILGETRPGSAYQWIRQRITSSKMTSYGLARASKSQQWALVQFHTSMITT